MRLAELAETCLGPERKKWACCTPGCYRIVHFQKNGTFRGPAAGSRAPQHVHTTQLAQPSMGEHMARAARAMLSLRQVRSDLPQHRARHCESCGRVKSRAVIGRCEGCGANARLHASCQAHPSAQERRRAHPGQLAAAGRSQSFCDTILWVPFLAIGFEPR